MQRVKEMLTKIKEGHPLWVNGDSAYKDRLEKAFEPLFIQLEEFGIDRSFSESLLFFGGEFVDSLVSTDEIGPIELEDIRLIFDL